MRKRRYIVYCATNRTNGKRYIGITSRHLERRISEHASHARYGKNNGSFYRAVRKYGIEAFDFVEILECKSRQEVVASEIRLIAEMRPEYNSTKGGDGQLGRPMTAKGRASLSAFHRGKTWHNMPHSDRTRQRLRQVARTKEAKQRWAIYQNLGPSSMARSVRCIDDGSTYESASAAARHYGVAKSALIELCLGRRYRKSIGGLRFEYI